MKDVEKKSCITCMDFGKDFMNLKTLEKIAFIGMAAYLATSLRTYIFSPISNRIIGFRENPDDSTVMMPEQVVRDVIVVGLGAAIIFAVSIIGLRLTKVIKKKK
jgi:hypothetical protein